MIYLSGNSYPKTGALLTNILPLYEFFFPKIFGLFVKHCKSEKLARQALTVGYYPEIEVRPNKKFPTAPGYYQGANGGLLNRVFLNNVNPNTSRPDAYEANQNQIVASSLEMTTLHEMIHWARHVGGKPEVGREEAGVAFADEVFGTKGSRSGGW